MVALAVRAAARIGGAPVGVVPVSGGGGDLGRRHFDKGRARLLGDAGGGVDRCRQDEERQERRQKRRHQSSSRQALAHGAL